ncbi:unnamed protein product [Orchesella dallaii]|uniref:SAM-dependent MTase RsmB/NOP-type domain-containing protein n=1 Tax=Orchesella dallaii TaxID=48710 RepID=A0ABP1QCX0_9HEXA
MENSGSIKRQHSVKVPRLYKDASKALKQVEESGEGLKNAIHSLKHPNIKALTALVSEALKHSRQLEVVMKKSKLLKNEVGLSKQTYLAKILITELLWGKKRLGGESKPVVTVLSYKDKFEKALAKLESVNDDATGGLEDAVFRKPRYVRINTLKLAFEDAVSYLLDEGWNQVVDTNYCYLEPHDFAVDDFVDNLLVFAAGVELHDHPLYKNGSFVLQDKASCLAALALKPRSGRQIIDACAAPGMKTSLLAALTEGENPIIAIEKSTRRFETLNTILADLGVTSVTTLNQNFTDLIPEEYKDVEYILVDPSCSGSGMYGRLEIQLQSREKDAERIQRLSFYQQKLLRHAMRFPSVKRIVYSTCSINSEENEDVIASALEWINTPTPEREDVGLSGVNWSFKLKRALPNWTHRLNNEQYHWADMCVKADESDLTDGFFVSVLERVK